MHYSFKKTVYMDGDGRKNSYPSVVIENSEKYGSFFLDEINHLSLDYVEDVGEIEAVLNGEVDFYEGFGFEMYMIECDREKSGSKECIRRRQGRSYYPYRRGLCTDERLARFSTSVLSQPYLIIEMVGYRAFRIYNNKRPWSSYRRRN